MLLPKDSLSAPEAAQAEDGGLKTVRPWRLQRVAVSFLSLELGWELPTPSATDAVSSEDDLANRLRGMRITIYSLTESSCRQAKAALEEIGPTVIVDINSDHGGTARLRSLAENGDLFVMTWLSAKHSATDYIRAHRGARPLIYSRGKGVSSILRAVEEYFCTKP